MGGITLEKPKNPEAWGIGEILKECALSGVRAKDEHKSFIKAIEEEDWRGIIGGSLSLVKHLSVMKTCGIDVAAKIGNVHSAVYLALARDWERAKSQALMAEP